MHLHEFGPPDGSPLLALHGVSGHGGRFADLAARLGHYHVIAPDLRGHGRSSPLPPWSLEQQIDDLLTLLEPGVKTPVIGQSLGGVLAARLAHAAPERIGRLVLIDIATLSSKRPELALANAERMRIDVSYADRVEARADRVRNGWQDVAADLLDAEIEAHLEQREDGRWHWRYCRSALVAVFGELTRPVPAPPPGVPTMLLSGRASPAVTADYRAACLDALGDDLTQVELDCGHLVYYERPAETAEHISAFLAPAPG